MKKRRSLNTPVQGRTCPACHTVFMTILAFKKHTRTHRWCQAVQEWQDIHPDPELAHPQEGLREALRRLNLT